MSFLLADAYLHTMDPFAIELSDGWGLRWYGLSYAFGFVIGWLITRWLARNHRILIPLQTVGDYMVYLIVGVVVGGRLGYVLFYHPEYLFQFTADIPFWEVLAFNRGGMASHGGIIGVLLASALFGLKRQISPWHVIDVSAFICPAGLFLGRIANFINGELWGKALPDSAGKPWWSIQYPQEIYQGHIDLEPLREVIPGELGFNDRVIELANQGDPQVTVYLQEQLTAFYPSQIIQAISDGPILIAVLAIVWLVPRKPGIISGTFLLTYGILRIFTELFRQADDGIAVIAGLQRGQLLSVLMIVCGVFILAYCSLRPTERVGGLLKTK
ncbi:MAG: prolipoprotein diacylglyceryl transferase [Phycisphaerales bacterium]|nr:prolipoprotein diacylglyceryl transferase [Phycisphaerales bacterium]